MMLPRSLHGVDIHNNPWRCDCNLRQLRQWLVQYNVPSSIEPKCLTPRRLRSHTIKHVAPEDLACAPEVRPSTLFLDVVDGKNVSFECHIRATPDAHVWWRFDGLPLENASFYANDEGSGVLSVYEDRDLTLETVSYLRIEGVVAAHSGVYQCVAENEAATTVSNFTLRVSPAPTTTATPVVSDQDNVAYLVGGALLAGIVIVLVALCSILIKCLIHRRSVKKSEVKSSTNREGDKPKYIQMGGGSVPQKLNGILVDTPAISVIENSPYRTETGVSNPDLISDAPDETRVKVKKKVSISGGVEEMDAHGNRTTRPLDDILEEESDEPPPPGYSSYFDHPQQHNCYSPVPATDPGLMYSGGGMSQYGPASYVSVGGSQTCEYECCHPNFETAASDNASTLGRIQGDGCSFDNLIHSCSSAVAGGHCCSGDHHMFEDLNYRPLEEAPHPPPPAGYGDSEDEIEDMDGPQLSPGTRILYSPKEDSVE